MLNEIEVRIIGSLIEKELTTPDYFPLTLNALTAACNQKSNRSPVVTYDEATIEHWLGELRRKGIVQSISTPGSRAIKYRHSFLEEFRLIPHEAVILCELMLRGPQTVGEIRAHSSRMYEVGGLEAVEDILEGLIEREEPLITRLQRQSGKKEARYMHLLSGMPPIRETDRDVSMAVSEAQYMPGDKRVDKLGEEVSGLRKELDELRKSFEEFKARFD